MKLIVSLKFVYFNINIFELYMYMVFVKCEENLH